MTSLEIWSYRVVEHTKYEFYESIRTSGQVDSRILTRVCLFYEHEKKNG